MNAFQWDLRYAPGYDPPGFRAQHRRLPRHLRRTDDPSGHVHRGAAVRHAETAKRRYGAARSARASGAGDLEARLALEQQILATIDQLDRAIAAAMSARAKLPPAGARKSSAEIAQLVQLDMRSSEADVLHATKIREQLGFLLNSLEGAYARPTAAEYATYGDLKALAEAGEAKLAIRRVAVASSRGSYA